MLLINKMTNGDFLLIFQHLLSASLAIHHFSRQRLNAGVKRLRKQRFFSNPVKYEHDHSSGGGSIVRPAGRSARNPLHKLSLCAAAVLGGVQS